MMSEFDCWKKLYGQEEVPEYIGYFYSLDYACIRAFRKHSKIMADNLLMENPILSYLKNKAS